MVFSNAVNLPQLQQMVADYNNLEKQYNIQTNSISDCLAVQPPASVGCVNGVCTTVN